MTIARPASFLLLCVAAPFVRPSATVLAQTRPQPARAQAALPRPLTFDVTARVAAAGNGGPQQTFNARVWLSGSRARIETSGGGERAVMLWNAPYLYRLLPASKVGVRWTVGGANAPTARGFSLGALDPQALLRDPSRLRAALLQSGAKRAGTATLGGAATDIFQLAAPKGRLQKAKAWLRRSDALPVRLEASGGGASLVASWRNYARPKTLAASLFSPPPGFRIRAATSAPPIAGL